VALSASAAGIAVSEATEPAGVNHERAGSRAAGPTAAAHAPARRLLILGHSVRGRPIGAVALGPANARPAVLVVGCIHGNEPAGIAVADRLAHARIPSRSSIWIVRDLNPDGVAAGTRQNAHGVDLNRNFPFAWRPLGAPGDIEYSGPRALSEPESRIAHALILRLRPRITIWFHQHEDVTDVSGGDIRIERHFARLSGLPLRRLPRYPGSATGWQDHRLRGTTAFVVELPPGRLSRHETGRVASAVLALVQSPG
jgi:protein MpaA